MPTKRNAYQNRSLSYETLEARQLLAGVSHAILSGDWHSASTWDNGVPDDQTRAVIDSGVTVDLAGVDHVAQELVIQGNLVAIEGTATKTLTTRWIHVNSGGVFQIGSEADRYDANDFVITLTGEDPTDTFSIEGVGTDITDNDAFLMAASGGRLQFYGEDKLSFSKLKTTANVGDTQITLEKEIDRDFDGDIDADDGEVNWEVGDQIVIASSSRDYSDEEVRTIDNIACLVNGDVVITLDSALNNRHYGEIETYSNDTRDWNFDMRAEVALLSRNVKIQGLASQDTDNFFGDRSRFDAGTGDGFGAHTMIMGSAGQITVDNVQLDRMGQTARLGRYPIHWHLGGDRTGDIIRNASITNSNNRGLTIHGTHNVRVEGVVLHDIHGHGFFMEDAVETGNEYIANIAFGIHKVGRSAAVGNFAPDLNDPFIVDTHDHVGQNPNRFLSSAAYWVTNPDNTWIGNISAGSEGTGFWFILPDSAIGLSAEDSQYDNVRADRTNLRQFDFNSSHASPAGLNFDRGSDLEVPVGGAIKEFFAGDNWLPPQEPQINNFTAYQHGVAIYHRGLDANFHDNRIADSKIGTFITFTQRITDTLYVGHSRGNSDLSANVTGHSLYDGANTFDGTHFAGFADDDAHMFRGHSAARRHTHHVFTNTTFEDDGSADHVSIANQGATAGHSTPFGQHASALYDADGTLTGHAGGGPGSTVVVDHPFFRDSDDIKPSGWNAVISNDLYVNLAIEELSGDPQVKFTAPDGDTATGSGTHNKKTVVKNNAGDYTIEFPDGFGSISGGFDVYHYTRVGPSGSTVIRFPGLASTAIPENIARSNGGLASLRNATQSSFEIVDGDVWVKLFSSDTDVRFRFDANEAPVAVDDSVTTDEDVAITIPITGNDSDANGDTLYVGFGQVAVADYVDDFQSPNPGAGWTYQWNPNGEFGAGNYSDLDWDSWRYHPVGTTNFPYLGATFAHPGDGTNEGDGVERFAIAAFTVPVDGVYSISNSSITPNENTVNGVNVAAHISGQGVISLGQFDETDIGSSFDGSLGFASAGDVIYVGLGANASKGADGTTWDFTITRESSPVNGQLVLNADHTVTYTPDPGFNGSDSFGYVINDGRGGTDSAIVTIDVNSVPDLAAPVTVGSGTTARSIVNQIVVSFDDIVTLGSGAFSVTNTDTAQSATVSTSIDNSSGRSVVTLTMSGAITENGTNSLIDGNYELVIDGLKVQDSNGNFLDGDGDGVQGGDYVFGNDPADNFFRLYGDVTGDRNVNIFDLLQFRQSYLASSGDAAFNAQLDVNGDGIINVFDLLRFRQNYLKQI